MLKLSQRLTVLWMGAALLGAVSPVCADDQPFQGYVEMPQTLAPMIMGNLANENLRLLNEANGHEVKAAPAKAPERVTIAPASPGDTAAAHALAKPYPAAQRGPIEQAFQESLRRYQQIEAKFGIPRDDVAGAVAAFLAGNYMAYRDVDFPDRHFGTLVAQMRGVLVRNPAFVRSSGAEKREVYEQLAIVGTFMATTRELLKRQPPNATIARNFRASARANLERFLKADADRVTIDGGGLVIH